MTAPSGTVSFLFTDVAGSTRLWDADREGMAASLAAHDRIMRDGIEAHGGYVFSIAGDSFGAAFATADSAVACAVRVQLELKAEAWRGPEIRVRMGIHTGSSEERAGNYFGPDVNRAARVMSAANGGQLLLSGVTAELLASNLPEPLRLVDRGVHALKDLDRPEHLFEVRHPELPEVAGDLHTLDVDQVHLPAQLTSFVGREDDLAEVADLLLSTRLLTIAGAGGTGKTRLAVEAARRSADRFEDGVWMADLSPVADAANVLTEIAAVWDLRPGDDVPLIEVVKSHLARRSLLLVVDNCEHVVRQVVDVLTHLLGAAPGLVVIATSRESLGVRGESVFRIPSLRLPASDADAAESEAVRLFLDRAGLEGAGPSPGELSAIVRVCRRVDGIPLGIELAAARMRVISAVELADRLDDSFRILASGAKAGSERHRTLQTTIAWSHDQLDDREATLFRRLSVFAGGFDLAAAEAIGAGTDVEQFEVLDLLDQLVDKSLVTAIHSGDRTRFRLLAPIRAFARERLVQAGQEDETRLTHARYFAQVVHDAAPRLRGPSQQQTTLELTRDFDEIRAAFDCLLARGEYETHLQAGFDLLWFWAQSSLLVEGREILLAGLETGEAMVAPAVAARAWWAASSVAVYLTDPKGVEYAAKGLERARDDADPTLVAWLRLQVAVAEAAVGSGPVSREEIDSTITALTSSGATPMWDPEWDSAAVSFFLPFAGIGSPTEKRRWIDQGVDRMRRLGDDFFAATGLLTAAYVDGPEHDEWAIPLLREGVQILRRLGFRHGLGHALFYYGARSQDSGLTEGLDELADASTMLAEVGDIPCSTWSAARLVRSLLDEGRLGEARGHLGMVAERLLGFEREFPSDLIPLACRWATDANEFDLAGRLVGFLGDAGQEWRPAVDTALGPDAANAIGRGAAADIRTVLGWIAGIG